MIQWQTHLHAAAGTPADSHPESRLHVELAGPGERACDDGIEPMAAGGRRALLVQVTVAIVTLLVQGTDLEGIADSAARLLVVAAISVPAGPQIGAKLAE